MPTKAKDTNRAWLWWFLAILVGSQLYVVQELAAALALFTLGFAAIAALVASLYVVQKGWQLAAVRIAEINIPFMKMPSSQDENQKATYAR